MKNEATSTPSNQVSASGHDITRLKSGAAKLAKVNSFYFCSRRAVLLAVLRAWVKMGSPTLPTATNMPPKTKKTAVAHSWKTL